MPEHTIPESLVDQVKAGRAVLVVGAGIGVPSWKQLLERLTAALAVRGREGDDVLAKDVEKIIHKGNLSRALAFLARNLGEEACDQIVESLWSSPAETPSIVKALAQLPFRHVWTTFPGDVLERAFEVESPRDWPQAKVALYSQLADVSSRRRTLVKILGDFGNYVVTPRSVRRAFSGAVDLRDYARDLYVEGTLVFVGFRYGDPDLTTMLDRVLGVFEPPRSTHYLLGAGVGPVTIDELMAEHRIEVINLAGKGADEIAERSVVEWLEELCIACNKAQISLHQAKPDADDLEGWLERYVDDSGEARDAIDLIERNARAASRHDRVIEVLLGRIEHTSDPEERAQLLAQAAVVYEDGLSDLRRAFEALTTACALDPTYELAAQNAERLAAATGGWSELVSEASHIATDATEPTVASQWWARLGRWYSERLDRHDYATPSLRRALELDPYNRAAHVALTELLRKQHKWAELADALRAQIEVETQDKLKVDLLLALADLSESHLAATAKAIEAYQAAADLDDSNDDALASLERLYRRDERWANLAKVLERRAEVCDAGGDGGRAAALRRELATMRVEKLGDLEGAISRYEAALTTNGADLVALRALEDLYDKTGRTDDYLRTLERLAQVAPDNEKLSTLRKLASELEDRDGAAARAVKAYESILAVDGNADDAYRGLARLLRSEQRWYDLVGLLERHIASSKVTTQRVELYLAAGEIQENELDDPHRAIEAYLNATAMSEGCKPALIALARLYERTEAVGRGIDVLVRHAELEGDRGAPLWAEAGRLAFTRQEDTELAERYLQKAIGLDPENLPALRLLAEVNEQRGSWASAIENVLRAEQASSSRLERVELLCRAAELAENKLEDAAKAQDLYERVLKLDPDHAEAGDRVADRLVKEGRWEDALPALEMLARRSEGQDRLERSRREAQLGRAYEALHRNEKAARHYRQAVEADPDNMMAALGLAAVLMAEAKLHEGAASVDKWKEVDQRYREVLARHRTGLADGQVAEIWYRLGCCAGALGEDKKAEQSFRRALEREPMHEPTLLAMVELASKTGDWKTVVEAKRAQIEGATEAIKVKLLDEIGDIWREKLKDTTTAVGAYLEGLIFQPGSHVLLHKLLEAYTEQKQWRRAIETLDQLAIEEQSAERRARYHYAAAVVARDELQDVDLSVERFQAALDDVPNTPKALEGIDKLLADRKDWRNLARAYRRHLKRVAPDAPPERLLELWTRLGDICVDHLGDNEAAIEAYQVACDLAPDDAARQEQLADLYLEAGEAHRDNAIEQLQRLLRFNPERVELYKALGNLYRDGRELDKAWCVAQTLVFLGVASDAERALFEKYRPAQFIPATRRLTEELWQKAVIHSGEDRYVGAIFASTLGVLAGTSAQPPSAFGLDPAVRLDLERDGRLVSRVVKYATGVLALDPVPMVWMQEHGDGLRVANTSGGGRLVPSLLVGAPQVGKSDERELAFEIAKRLAYLRPERFATMALGTLPRLETAFSAAVAAAGGKASGRAGESGEGEGQKLTQSLRSQIPVAVLEQVANLSAKLGDRLGNGLITHWRSAADHTANRVGFILANDLETAARMIATENSALSTLSVKERLRELVSFSASEAYFSVRRHLGLLVREEASA
jgi:tetratricopeptide (TPR) repeat protein